MLVANASLTGSAGELVHQVVGSARLQLASRSPQGFDERVATASGALPGVRLAAPVLRENVAVVGPRGREAVQLLGVTPQAALLGGLGDRNFGPGGFRFAGGLLLPASVAAETGAEPGDSVRVLALGSARTIKVGGVLGSSPFGTLSSSPVALTLLPVAQRLTGLPRRVTQVYVEPRPGQDARVASELRGLAGSSLDVEAADQRAAAARTGGPAERPVDLAVRGDQRDGRLPAGAERDAPDRARAAAVRRRPAHAGL